MILLWYVLYYISNCIIVRNYYGKYDDCRSAMPSHTRVTDPIWKQLLYKGRLFSERRSRGEVQPSVIVIFYSWQAMYCANSWQGRQIMIVVDLVFQQQVILKSEVWKRLEQFNVLLEEVTTEPQTTWPISSGRSTKVYMMENSWCRQRKKLLRPLRSGGI